MVDKPNNKTAEELDQKMKQQRMNIWPYVTAVIIYYVVLSYLSLTNLISEWPDLTDSSQSSEVQMIKLVIIAGVLGSLIHGFRSLFWYVGNREYAKSWTLMYFLIPFVGALLSLAFYFVLRGGLFSPQATVEATSPFGFVGIASLVGMFSNKAALKLQEVADSLFSTQSSTKGKDNVDPKKEE